MVYGMPAPVRRTSSCLHGMLAPANPAASAPLPCNPRQLQCGTRPCFACQLHSIASRRADVGTVRTLLVLGAVPGDVPARQAQLRKHALAVVRLQLDLLHTGQAGYGGSGRQGQTSSRSCTACQTAMLLGPHDHQACCSLPKPAFTPPAGTARRPFLPPPVRAGRARSAPAAPPAPPSPSSAAPAAYSAAWQQIKAWSNPARRVRAAAALLGHCHA